VLVHSVAGRQADHLHHIPPAVHFHVKKAAPELDAVAFLATCGNQPTFRQ
jgi:hypothetical protein